MLKELMNFLNNLGHLSNQRKLEMANSSINNICKQIDTQESLKPIRFFNSVQKLLKILEIYLQTSDPSDVIFLYRTIQTNISKFVSKYNQEKLQVVIMSGYLMMYEISKILKPLMTVLNFDIFNNLDVQIQDPNLLLARNFANLFHTVIEFNFNQILPQFIQSFQKGNWRQNWKMQAAYFICIAQFTKINGIQKQESFMETIKNGLRRQNPMINYYALYTMSCLIKELDPQKLLQQQYNYFISAILLSISRPKYLAHKSLQCFKLFIRKFDKRVYLQKKINVILIRIKSFMAQFNSINIKNCYLDCLVILSEISLMYDSKQLNKCIKYCTEIIQNLKDKKQQTLKGKAIKCLCLIINNFRYNSQVQFYINIAIDYLQGKKISEDTLLTCWKILCFTGVKFKRWIKIFPSVFQIAKKYCKINSFQKRSLAYLVFKYTPICFGVKFQNYFVPTLEIIMSCLIIAVKQRKKVEVEEICSAIDAIISSQSLKSYFSEYSHQKPNQITEQQKKARNLNLYQIFPNQIKEILSYIFEVLLNHQEVENQIKESLLFSLKVIIEHFGEILPKQYKPTVLDNFWLTVHIFDKLINYQSQREVMKLSLGKESNNQFQQGKKKSLNQCRIVLPLILAAIIKHIPTKSQKMFHKTMIEINKFQRDHYDIICIARYIASIQLLPFNQIKQQYHKFIQFLRKYSTFPYPSVRTQINNAIIFMASNTPILNNFQMKLQDWKDIIENCRAVPKNQFECDEYYNACQESYISAIGYLLYNYRKQSDLKIFYDIWLDNLPLKCDKKQNRIQINLLSKIFIAQPHTFYQLKNNEYSEQSINRVFKMLKIFSQAKSQIERELNTKQNRNTLRKAYSAVRIIIEQDIFKENSSRIQNELSKEQRAHFQELLRREY